MKSAVELVGREVVDRLLRRSRTHSTSQPREDADVLAAHAEPAPAEEVAALAPDEHELDLRALVLDDEAWPPP